MLTVTYPTRSLWSALLLIVAVSFSPPARAQDAVQPATQEQIKAPANPSFPATAPSATTSYGSTTDLAQFLFGQDNFPDSFYDKVQAWKEKYHLPISIGANHWFHIDRDEHVYGNGYGVPSENGTYYYYIALDPSFKVGDKLGNGFVDEIGAHVQYRIRDGNKLRPFYSDTHWFYEAYGYAKTKIGTFKAGQLVTEFGVPWDGTWWEGVPYFDGYKFDPDYGFSWDNKWKVSDTFTVDSAAQFFVASDGINGSISGADAESGLGLAEQNTGVVRLVPTWKFNEDTSLAWGVSGLLGGIKGAAAYRDVDGTRGVWGTDLTFTWKNFSLFGEYIDAYGATNPTRYVSGGPSDHVNSLRGGVSYKYGPTTFRVNYSYGWDHNPNGHQFIFDPGVTIQLLKNVVLYAEYVKWDVVDQAGNTAKFDDGFELILVWNL